MSFNNEIKKVKDEFQSRDIRYISLRHCVELYCPFGFNKTWMFMEQKFGLKEGERNDNNVFIQCAKFLECDRNAWLKVLEKQGNFAKNRAFLGLPKPKFKCEHK